MAKMDATLADISKIDQTVKNVKAKLARLLRDKVECKINQSDTFHLSH